MSLCVYVCLLCRHTTCSLCFVGGGVNGEGMGEDMVDVICMLTHSGWQGGRAVEDTVVQFGDLSAHKWEEMCVGGTIGEGWEL